MTGVTITEYKSDDETGLLELYNSVGWRGYYGQPERLKQAFAGSLCVLGAYAGTELVGLCRVVGDGITVVFLQDILIKPEFQRQGIGRRLIAAMLHRYRNVRQFHLMTDDLPSTVGFYKAVGFLPAEELHYRAFSRLRYE